MAKGFRGLKKNILTGLMPSLTSPSPLQLVVVPSKENWEEMNAGKLMGEKDVNRVLSDSQSALKFVSKK